MWFSRLFFSTVFPFSGQGKPKKLKALIFFSLYGFLKTLGFLKIPGLKLAGILGG